VSGKEHILHSTLEQLDGERWGEPPYNSYLVKRTHELRTVPLNKFTTEDLRMMIGQKFSLDYLIPLALDVLAEDPMAEGHHYPGALIESILKVDPQFWEFNKDLWLKANRLVKQSKQKLKRNGIAYTGFNQMFTNKK
jgi:hypothetical protein